MQVPYVNSLMQLGLSATGTGNGWHYGGQLHCWIVSLFLTLERKSARKSGELFLLTLSTPPKTGMWTVLDKQERPTTFLPFRPVSARLPALHTRMTMAME